MGSINVCLERKRRGDCGVLGIYLVEATGVSMGTVELFLVGGLLWLNSSC